MLAFRKSDACARDLLRVPPVQEINNEEGSFTADRDIVSPPSVENKDVPREKMP